MIRLIFLFSVMNFSKLYAQEEGEQIALKADQYLQALSSLNRFQGAVLIAKEGRILYQKALGFASLEDSIPNKVDTRFPIASISKSFTATAILMLAERGRIKLEDRITSYLNECPESWQDISIHHLLSHSSGISDYSDDSLWLVNRSSGIDFHQTISLFRNKPLLFKPGTKYTYSNSGYVLLGYLIERITGQPYEKFISEQILQPLHMTNTFIDDNKMIISKRARGYERQGLELQNFSYLNMNIGKSAGGLVSTVGDLLKWDQSFYTGQLLSASSRQKMFTIYAGDYGYGWHIDSLHGQRRVTHSGGILGYKTNIDRFPDKKVTIIILCNSYDVFINSAIRDLAAITLGAKYTIPQRRKGIVLDKTAFNKYVGTYQAKDFSTYKISIEQDSVVAELKGRKFIIVPETEEKFFAKEWDAQILFEFSTENDKPTLKYNKSIIAYKISVSQ